MHVADHGASLSSEVAVRVVLLVLLVLCGYRYVKPGPSRRLPPLVPSSAFIPYVGSAVQLSRAPLRFLRECHEKYGGPFRVRLMGKDMVIVVGRDDFAPVVRNKALSFMPASEEIMVNMFQCDTMVPEMRGQDADGNPVDAAHPDTLWHRTHGQYGTCLRNRDAVADLTERSFGRLKRSLMRLAPGREADLPEKVDLFSWTQKFVFDAVLHTIFGDCDGLGTSEEVRALFDEFDDAFPILGAGLPSFLTRLAAGKQLAAYETLVTRWQRMILDRDEQGMRDASKLMSERNGFFQRQFNYSTGSNGKVQARGALIQAKFHMSLLFGGYANTAPSMFWLLYYLARDSNAWQAIYEEVQRELPSVPLDGTDGDSIRWSSEDLDRLKLMDSAITETLRLANGASAQRIATTDTTVTFGEGASARTYDFPAGQNVLLVGIRGARANDEVDDEEIDGDGDKFRFDRYASGKPPSGARHVTPFGAGASMCPGRFWARNVLKTALALVMTAINRIDLDHAAGDVAPDFDVSRIFFGVYRPVGDVPAKLHWRTPANAAAR
ncbi:unnamed protein product (mitochondrion) [Plasmodiophora brassicae]|uniref:Cytochrome P450 n=1 Tax=Plasmodiophora brassicae TaxID=37360 RepID=A0A0G4IX17_PLABS|nr:hypothetical protein PBRA_007531 [Plasmodiophora brassicae]SPR02110.1 unnamed protein product [Plasmodiophora brassicae]